MQCLQLKYYRYYNRHAVFTKYFNVERCIDLQPQYQVKEQGQGHAGKLPPNELLRWLKEKSTYDITFDDNNQFTDKGIIVHVYWCT